MSDYADVVDPRTGLVRWRSTGADDVQILPDVNADLMFWRGGLHIAGYDTVPHRFDRGRGETTYGVRLPAGSLPLLLHDSAATATDARVPLATRHVDRLARLLDELPDAADPGRILIKITHRLLVGADAEPRAVQQAAAIMHLASRNRPVAAIADALGWTERRLHRFSVDTFGTSVSMLRSLHRFRTGYTLLSAGLRPAEVAAAAGYADQAHLTRHVRRFAATTPAALIRDRASQRPAAES